MVVSIRAAFLHRGEVWPRAGRRLGVPGEGPLVAVFPHRYAADGSHGDARQHGGDVPGSFFRTGLADDPYVAERSGELVFDRAKRRVTLAGRPLRLTITEYQLLRALSLDAGGVATDETLLRRVWGEQGGGNMEALRSAVTKLRRKLGDDARKPRYVIGERGLGYRMPEADGA